MKGALTGNTKAGGAGAEWATKWQHLATSALLFL